jgi:hypothetical protein
LSHAIFDLLINLPFDYFRGRLFHSEAIDQFYPELPQVRVRLHVDRLCAREAIKDLEIRKKHEFDGNSGERFAVMHSTRISFTASRESNGRS